MAAAQRRQVWWPGRMAAAFGPPFLCLVCLVYFIQLVSSLGGGGLLTSFPCCRLITPGRDCEFAMLDLGIGKGQGRKGLGREDEHRGDYSSRMRKDKSDGKRRRRMPRRTRRG